jgi:predicted dehydrogenase
VAYQQRTSILNKAVKQIIADGSLGRIFAADLEIRCWRDQAYYDSASYRGNKAIDGGGPFIQQGAHGIDLYAWFFGKPEKTLSLLGTFCHDIEGEDHGVAILKHANGMIGSIIASTAAYPGFPQRLTVHCEKGSFIIENNAVKFWDIKGVEQPSLQETYTHTGASTAAVADTSGHENIIKDFIDAVKQGRAPLVSGEDARVATEIILDIYSSNQY